MERKIRSKGLKPAQVIVLSFLFLIIVGGFLLALPQATKSGESVGLINSFFTSTSATCVTGLVVGDTGSTYSAFGQVVIMLLIQLGGLGIMTITAFVYFLIGRRITLKERLIISQSINEEHLPTVRTTVQRIFVTTFICEFMGALLLATRFIPMYGTVQGIYYSIFHSISAFCNAGFDVFGNGNSLMPFVNDPVVNITIMSLIILGGLGFIVIIDLYQRLRKRRQRLSMQSRVVLYMTGGLILVGAIVYFLLEGSNPKTLGDPDLPVGSKVMGAIFQSITPRTAGFNTIDQANLSSISKFFTMILMFIGASPAGTGGGIKTTTLAIIILFLASVIRGKHDVNCGHRRIETGIVTRAITITFLSLTFTIVVAALVILFEQRGDSFTFEHALYEVISGFGTVGLSTGITPFLTVPSKLLIMVTMFVGRVGMLTLTFALANIASKDRNAVRFPEEKIMVG